MKSTFMGYNSVPDIMGLSPFV